MLMTVYSSPCVHAQIFAPSCTCASMRRLLDLRYRYAPRTVPITSYRTCHICDWVIGIVANAWALPTTRLGPGPPHIYLMPRSLAEDKLANWTNWTGYTRYVPSLCLPRQLVRPDLGTPPPAAAIHPPDTLSHLLPFLPPHLLLSPNPPTPPPPPTMLPISYF